MLGAAALLLAAWPALALAHEEKNAANPLCPLLPASAEREYPGDDAIVTSNRLRQPAGKPTPALGQTTLLTGKIFDRRCVPLQNARVVIWQADALGSMVLPHPGDFATPDPLFAVTGETFTDNEGNYSFVTVFPGTHRGAGNRERAPHIHFRVTHPALKAPFFVEMFFAGDRHNVDDPHFKALPEASRQLVSAAVRPAHPADPNQGLAVHFDMALPASDAWREY